MNITYRRAKLKKKWMRGKDVLFVDYWELDGTYLEQINRTARDRHAFDTVRDCYIDDRTDRGSVIKYVCNIILWFQ